MNVGMTTTVATVYLPMAHTLKTPRNILPIHIKPENKIIRRVPDEKYYFGDPKTFGRDFEKVGENWNVVD